MFGFQPIAFNYNKISSGPAPCVTLTWKGIFPFLGGQVGVFFTYNLNELINTGIVEIWTISGLPPGITGNTSTGIISGTPTTLGNYNVSISADNSCTNPPISNSIDIEIN